MGRVTRAYEELTYRGQVARMRTLGRRALPRFGIRRDAPLVLCGHGENTVFRTLDRRGRAHALRVHRLDYQTPAAIRSEMMWLRALAEDTDISAPVPRKGRDGAFVQQVGDDGVPGERSCVLWRWTEGRIVGWRRGPTYWTRLGELTAQLHAHGRTWKRPRDFTRRRWDEKELLISPAFGDPFAAPGLRRRDRELFVAARDRALAALREFGQGRRRWGLIHADLHSFNVVTRDGELRPIDFDDCGFGWYLYDIMVSLIPFWGTSRYESTLECFLEGYRRVLPFDDGDLAQAEPFVVARKLDMLGWLASRSDNPLLARRVPMGIKRAREGCRDYLRS